MKMPKHNPARCRVVRHLTPRELDLLARSKADFAAGRSHSHDEIKAMLDERLAARGVPKSTA